jgi:NADH-quinone oxidoreductase subunit C
MTSDLAARASEFGASLDTSGFDPVIFVPKERYRALVTSLKEDGWILSDLTAVDRLETLEVILQLVGEAAGQLAVKVVLSGEEDVVDSLTTVFSGTEWLEREVYDMFGVTFEGHPDMTRILMMDRFLGHPLLKTFELDVDDGAQGQES